MKTVVMVNTLTSVNAWAYSSHCQEWFRMAKDFPDDDFILHTPCRVSIDHARNQAVQIALETESEYIYFIDDDMILHPRTYRSLRNCEGDIVMAHSVIRGYPYQDMMFIDPLDKGFESLKRQSENLIIWADGSWKDKVDDRGRLRVDSIGCAAVLYKTELFKELQPPYFVTLPNMTEDVYCCLKLQERFGRANLHIYVDTKVPTGHILYSEVATPKNAKDLKEWNEKQNPYLVKSKKGDRDDTYKDMVEEQFACPV